MPFEQPGVANIRERKAARHIRHSLIDIPHEGSIEYVVWLARQQVTPEQAAEFHRKSAELCAEMEREAIRRKRCGDCGADTLNYSHSFSCKWRGSGF